MSMEQVFSNTLIVIRGTGGETYGDFNRRIHDYAASLGALGEIVFCKVALTEGPPPKLSVIPYKKGPVALVTICTAENAEQSADWYRRLAEGVGGFCGCYRGECVLPAAYEKSWEDGIKTPGAGLLTLFKRRPDIDYDTFIRRWHDGHTPLSLEIHPLWNYVRNVVREKMLPESEHFDGIVEEHFRTRRDLTGWARFFGGFGRMIGNMMAVYKDMNGFIDRKTIEPYFISEYWIKDGRLS